MLEILLLDSIIYKKGNKFILNKKQLNYLANRFEIVFLDFDFNQLQINNQNNNLIQFLLQEKKEYIISNSKIKDPIEYILKRIDEKNENLDIEKIFYVSSNKNLISQAKKEGLNSIYFSSTIKDIRNLF